MSIATITSKGQLTLPKDVRDKLKLEAGEKIDIHVDEQTGTAIITPLNKRVNDVFGILHKPKQRPVTLEEMDQAIRQHSKDKHT